MKSCERSPFYLTRREKVSHLLRYVPVRGRSQTTLTKLCPLLTTYLGAVHKLCRLGGGGRGSAPKTISDDKGGGGVYGKNYVVFLILAVFRILPPFGIFFPSSIISGQIKKVVSESQNKILQLVV